MLEKININPEENDNSDSDIIQLTRKQRNLIDSDSDENGVEKNIDKRQGIVKNLREAMARLELIFKTNSQYFISNKAIFVDGYVVKIKGRISFTYHTIRISQLNGVNAYICIC
ncbi:hypothetical protein V1478_004471 [Vespula squamosa]|uniref:Uncharacterized protein n=1 Tax=Vespula squamosa TaxID=30214 RepID=A0ABD2BGA7_VESSQ